MPHETRESAAARRQLRAAGFMAGQVLPASQEIAAPPELENGMAPLSVDAILQRARAMTAVYNGTATDEQMMAARGEWWSEHPTLGSVFIGPMPNVGYDELARVGKLNREESEAKIYLHRGILKPRFEAAQITELYPMIEGPPTQALVAAIKRWNPSYQDRQSWVDACIGADQWLLMFLTCAINCQLWPQLTDLFDAGRELSEEQQAVKLVFDRLMKYLPFYSAILGIGEVAAQNDLPLTMAGAMTALERSRELAEKDFAPGVLPEVS